MGRILEEAISGKRSGLLIFIQFCKAADIFLIGQLINCTAAYSIIFNY